MNFKELLLQAKFGDRTATTELTVVAVNCFMVPAHSVGLILTRMVSNVSAAPESAAGKPEQKSKPC